MTETRFILTVKCAECGEQLAQSNPIPEKEKATLMLQAPLVTPACPKGCRSTYNDCNCNTTHEWAEAEPEKGPVT